MPAIGQNLGIGLLQEFDEVAVAADNARLSTPAARGRNGGLQVQSGVDLDSPDVESLNNRNCARLSALVRSQQSRLEPRTLWAIHEIAIERLRQPDNPLAAGAAELSRDLLRAAAGE